MNCHARGCPPLDPGGQACHCAACHQTFSNPTLFEDHQQWSQEGPGKVACKDPGALGLVRAANGAWWTPEGLTVSTERVAKMNLARAA